MTSIAMTTGSRGAQDWETPRALWEKLDAEFHFTVDAACHQENMLGGRGWDMIDDGLSQDWDPEVVWCNPPFNESRAWIAKAAGSHGTSVLLVPASVDTRWWHEDVVGTAHEVRFIRGRIRFLMEGVPAPAVLPHAMAILVWRPGPPPPEGPAVTWGYNWPDREPGSWVSR